MRCQHSTGFLMMRQCEGVAEWKCAYCGRNICREHAAPVTPEMPAPAGGRPDPRAEVQLYACPACARKYAGEQAAPGAVGQPGRRPWLGNDPYDDPYYRYPYYGSYQPYWFGNTHHYTERDREVFERGQQGADGGIES